VSQQLRPMLATEADPDKLKFPLICQPKYDGIRCIIGMSGEGLSRTLKRIPNLYIQDQLQRFNGSVAGGTLGLDGEIVTYTNGRMDSLHEVQSKVMRVDGMPDFQYYVFDDYCMKSIAYERRHSLIIQRIGYRTGIHEIVTNYVTEDLKSTYEYEEHLVANGWEGMIGRDPNGRYKYGRSTVNEGLLLKFKRFTDDEGVVIGFEELEHNLNEAEFDERGLSKRSSHKDGKVSGGVLGALIISWNNVEFKIGTGFDAIFRKTIWDNKSKYLGQSVTFKYKGVGPNGKPLLPAFKAFRTDLGSKRTIQTQPDQIGLFDE
jgi:DNA ligase 1